MSEAPPFWFEKPAIAARALSPLAAIYGHIAGRRMLRPPTAVADVPVLCIGNFIAGGGGKTPTAVSIAKIARSMGLRPGFLSRGYGGIAKQPTVVDLKSHSAMEVGDEPLILAVYATTVVAANRPAGPNYWCRMTWISSSWMMGFKTPRCTRTTVWLLSMPGAGSAMVIACPPGHCGRIFRLSCRR